MQFMLVKKQFQRKQPSLGLLTYQVHDLCADEPPYSGRFGQPSFHGITRPLHRSSIIQFCASLDTFLPSNRAQICQLLPPQQVIQSSRPATEYDPVGKKAQPSKGDLNFCASSSEARLTTGQLIADLATHEVKGATSHSSARALCLGFVHGRRPSIIVTGKHAEAPFIGSRRTGRVRRRHFRSGSLSPPTLVRCRIITPTGTKLALQDVTPCLIDRRPSAVSFKVQN